MNGKFLGVPKLLYVIAFFLFLAIAYLTDRSTPKVFDESCESGVISTFPTESKALYEKMYEGIKAKDISSRTYGALVNHHLLAGSFIAEVTESLKKVDPDTIILIAPNHFNHGQASIQAASLRFDSPEGVVRTDCGALQNILNTKIASIENTSFGAEHGVLNIIPFIARSLPRAHVVPIIIKENASYESLDKLAKVISKLPNTVVIGSFDFAHEMPPSFEAFKDEKSKDALLSFDLERLKNISVDSDKGLYLLARGMKEKGGEKFVQFQNTNSGALTHTDPNDATSYITGVFEKGSSKEAKTATVLIFGDLMLDRTVADRMKARGNDYLFSGVPNLFAGTDLIAVNLEGIFSNNIPVSRPGNDILRFTFNPSLVGLLPKWNIGAVSQANNHTNDFDREGGEASRIILKNGGVSVFGDFFNERDLVAVKEIAGQKIALIGYNDFASNTLSQVLSLIEKTKKENNFVIVMPHWGEEYAPQSNARQQDLARQFIDSGADAVVGSHPHVIQEIAIYKNKPIVYSLGNFVFDQEFSVETTEGLGLGLAIEKKELRLYLMPFTINQSQVQLMSQERRASILESLSRKSQNGLREQILQAKITIAHE